MNLSKLNIPQYAIDTLGLGEKFNLSVDFNYTDAFQIFKCVEIDIYYNKPIGGKIREDIINIVNSYSKNKPHIHQSFINHYRSLTHNLLKQNKRIMFTMADKGNVTVAIELDSYIQKVEASLSDKIVDNALRE